MKTLCKPLCNKISVRDLGDCRRLQLKSLVDGHQPSRTVRRRSGAPCEVAQGRGCSLPNLEVCCRTVITLFLPPRCIYGNICLSCRYLQGLTVIHVIGGSLLTVYRRETGSEACRRGPARACGRYWAVKSCIMGHDAFQSVAEVGGAEQGTLLVHQYRYGK